MLYARLSDRVRPIRSPEYRRSRGPADRSQAPDSDSIGCPVSGSAAASSGLAPPCESLFCKTLKKVMRHGSLDSVGSWASSRLRSRSCRDLCSDGDESLCLSNRAQKGEPRSDRLLSTLMGSADCAPSTGEGPCNASPSSSGVTPQSDGLRCSSTIVEPDLMALGRSYREVPIYLGAKCVASF